jgi:hypothetical protein
VIKKVLRELVSESVARPAVYVASILEEAKQAASRGGLT